jgi:hypothetical protein
MVAAAADAVLELLDCVSRILRRIGDAWARTFLDHAYFLIRA